ncbi:MAG: hypothetical protein H0U86_15675 [Chloroflexi bacterium]|nr:hypothetical protein [Chloroflexota bacterium]
MPSLSGADHMKVEVTSLEAATGNARSYVFPLADAQEAAVEVESPAEEGWYVVRHSLADQSGVSREIQSTKVHVTTGSGPWQGRSHAVVSGSPPTDWMPGEMRNYIVSVDNGWRA